MSKRKQPRAHDSDTSDGSGNDSSSDVSLVNVDFDFFDPNPKVDFKALKHLLSQLFQSDAELFHLNELAELILSQPLVGTTIKTDGIEGDPLAYLSVLSMRVHQNHPSISSLRSYIFQKSSPHPSLHAIFQSLLSIGPGPQGVQSQFPNNHVGFVVSERLVNMPVQVVPPMYRMLLDEIKWAVDDNEPYNFTHYLFLTRTYRLTAQQVAELENRHQEQEREDPEASRPSKKRKSKAKPPSLIPQSNGNEGEDADGKLSTYSFHPEDEYIQKYASYTHDYTLSSSSSGSGRGQRTGEDDFGLDVAGRMMLVPAENMAALVAEMSEAYAYTGPR